MLQLYLGILILPIIPNITSLQTNTTHSLYLFFVLILLFRGRECFYQAYIRVNRVLAYRGKISFLLTSSTAYWVGGTAAFLGGEAQKSVIS